MLTRCRALVVYQCLHILFFSARVDSVRLTNVYYDQSLVTLSQGPPRVWKMLQIKVLYQHVYKHTSARGQIHVCQQC